jgi:hypothetical protein
MTRWLHSYLSICWERHSRDSTQTTFLSQHMCPGCACPALGGTVCPTQCPAPEAIWLCLVVGPGLLPTAGEACGQKHLHTPGTQERALCPFNPACCRVHLWKVPACGLWPDFRTGQIQRGLLGNPIPQHLLSWADPQARATRYLLRPMVRLQCSVHSFCGLFSDQPESSFRAGLLPNSQGQAGSAAVPQGALLGNVGNVQKASTSDLLWPRVMTSVLGCIPPPVPIPGLQAHHLKGQPNV